jgi:hypothetical protein
MSTRFGVDEAGVPLGSGNVRPKRNAKLRFCPWVHFNTFMTRVNKL